MELLKAISLLETAVNNKRVSRQELIDACDEVASRILCPEAVGLEVMGYRVARGESLGQVIYILEKGAFAINHNVKRHYDDGWSDAPVRVLKQFAKDCHNGLVEEFAQKVADAANKQAVTTLRESTR